MVQVTFTLALFRGELVWQHLPVPFEVYADGIDFVIFRFGAGRAALHLADVLERNKLLQNEGYRREFRRQVAREQRWDSTAETPVAA
ncbi:hypothetical protein [Burkholderia pseudomallei]|uniref:hypothetical protein n=1 Tax=Burkholderia pseudomallei TaxID=28450 RepID=UPI00353231FA